MKRKTKWLAMPLTLCILAAALAGVYFLAPRLVPAEKFCFAYRIPESESALRQRLVP